MRRMRVSGFTFLEIMVVVAILAILAGLTIPRFVSQAEESRKTKAVVQIKELMKALELYRLDNGSYPTTEQGLKALVERPTGEPEPKKWRIYIDKIPLDPWKNEYIYLCPGANHTNLTDSEIEEMEGRYGTFDIMSYGPDGIESADDIKSWDLPDD